MDRGEYIDTRTNRLKDELFQLVALLTLSLATIGYKTDDKGRMTIDLPSLALMQKAFRDWALKVNISILPKIGSLMQDVHDIVIAGYTERGFKVAISKGILNIINKLGFSSKPAVNSYGAYIAKADEVAMRLTGYVMRSMISSKPHTDFLKEIKELVPQEFDRYYKTHVYDMGMQYDRVANNLYAEQLKLDHFVYEGGIIDTTRHFCDSRNGQVWTVAEAKAWNQLDWRGKIPGVDVLVQLGGYNCRHYMNYITEETYNHLKENEA